MTIWSVLTMRFRFVGRDNQLGEAVARTTRHQPDIVRDLVQRDRQRAQGTGKLNQGIVSALYCEFVWCTPERQVRQLRDFGGSCFAELRSGIYARSHCGSPEREAV